MVQTTATIVGLSRGQKTPNMDLLYRDISSRRASNQSRSLSFNVSDIPSPNVGRKFTSKPRWGCNHMINGCCSVAHNDTNYVLTIRD
jgi:hypothetical protein